MIKRLLLFLILTAGCFAITPSINSLNGGKIDATMEARWDFGAQAGVFHSKYSSSCRTLENFFPLSQGPATRRPGTKYIATVKTGSPLLLSFDSSVDDTYVIETGNLYKRFYRNGGQIQAGVGTEDISALDNIVAHWLCNETTGLTAADDDGGTHDGTISVDAGTVTATGKVGLGCFDLDGQYDVTVANNADFNFTDDSDDSAFSLACWAFITSRTDQQAILSKWRDSRSTSEWKLELRSDKKLKLILSDNTSNFSGFTVAQWKLNDDLADKAVDEAGGTHDGLMQVNNTEDITATGIIDKCLNFGGSDYATISDHDNLSFGDGSADSVMSVAAWVFVTSIAGDQYIVCKTGGTADEWRLSLGQGQVIRFKLFDDSEGSSIGVRSDDHISSGWHFMAATYDATESCSGIKLYLDGDLIDIVETPDGAYTAMENTAQGVSIGGSGVGANLWQNKIDNVMLFDVELSPSEIAALYNSGSGTEDLTGVGASSFAVTDSALTTGWHFI